MAKILKASITFWLIAANFFAFLVLLAVSFKNPNAMIAVAIQPSSILHGKYLWTLITSMFMHGSPTHLFVNMLSLLFLGSFLERILGRKRFFWFYMIAGIFAALFFVAIAAMTGIDLDAYAVGASGAIFGIGGLLAVLTPKLPVYIMFIPIAMPMWFGIALSLAVMWLVSAFAGLPIGNTAHLGGLIAGLVYGFYLRRRYPRRIKLLNRFLGFR